MTTPQARTAVLSLLLALVSPGYLSAASISGRVQLPKSKSTPVVNKRYEVITNGGVIATNPPLGVVYLEGNFPAAAAPEVKQVIQKDLTFTPLLLPVRVGTKVEFPNLDDAYHDVFSYSAPKRFDLGRYLKSETPTPSQTFDKPGLVTLRCDIHEHMRGLILVVNTPHFVVTDVEGRFQLNDLPAGSYTLKIWLDSKTTLERPVELQADSTLQVNIP